jgi:hypothetical protein
MFLTDWSALLTPPECHPGLKAYTSVTSRRLSPQLQFSLSSAALDMYLYGNCIILLKGLIWLGGNNQYTGGVFVWTDATPFTYTRWYAHQPDGKTPTGSVADPDPDPPDPHFFGPPGSGSFYHRAKIVRKTLIPTIL